MATKAFQRKENWQHSFTSLLRGRLWGGGECGTVSLMANSSAVFGSCHHPRLFFWWQVFLFLWMYFYMLSLLVWVCSMALRFFLFPFLFLSPHCFLLSGAPKTSPEPPFFPQAALFSSLIFHWEYGRAERPPMLKVASLCASFCKFRGPGWTLQPLRPGP